MTTETQPFITAGSLTVGKNVPSILKDVTIRSYVRTAEGFFYAYRFAMKHIIANPDDTIWLCVDEAAGLYVIASEKPTHLDHQTSTACIGMSRTECDTTMTVAQMMSPYLTLDEALHLNHHPEYRESHLESHFGPTHKPVYDRNGNPLTS